METNMVELWDKFGSNLKLFILKRVQDEAIAKDILQDVFISIHTHIDQLKDQTKIQSWVYQIARNLITDHFRRIQKIQNLRPSFEEIEEDTPTDFISETLTDLINMMSGLPEKYCEALCLTELGGMSQKAYAEKIGTSYSGAKSRIQRARLMLKDMLMNCCHYQFDKYGTVIDLHPIHCCCCLQYKPNNAVLK